MILLLRVLCKPDVGQLAVSSWAKQTKGSRDDNPLWVQGKALFGFGLKAQAVGRPARGSGARSAEQSPNLAGDSLLGLPRGRVRLAGEGKLGDC